MYTDIHLNIYIYFGLYAYIDFEEEEVGCRVSMRRRFGVQGPGLGIRVSPFSLLTGVPRPPLVCITGVPHPLSCAVHLNSTATLTLVDALEEQAVL